MEHILSCAICFQKYNSTTFIPRVLNCGHSFCTLCIKKLDSSICPNCRTSISVEADFPINYLVLSLIGECKTSESLNLDILPCIQNLRETLNIMLLDIEKEISEKIKIKNNIENNLEILKSLEHISLQEVGAINKSREKLNDMKKKCEQLSQSLSASSLSKNDDTKTSNFSHEYNRTDDSEQLSQSLSAASLSKNDDPKASSFSHKYFQTDNSLNVAEETSISLRRNEQLSSSAIATCLSNTSEISPHFSLKNSQTADTFLQEIYSALKNSENVFAFKYIDGKLKFGQLTIIDNELLIYSLTLNDAPNGSKTVSFEDLKESTKAKNLLTFIELKEHRGSMKIFFKLENNSLCSNFIKLCTGECGPSYKDCVYSSGVNYSENIDNSIILKADVLNQLSVESFSNGFKSTLTSIHSKDVLLMERPNEGFEVGLPVNITRGHVPIMGKVIKPTNLRYHAYFDHGLATFEIWDCGIATEL